jgi:hypothetical protein
MDHLSSKTIKELKEYAAENNINLQGARTKTKILSILLGNDEEAAAPVKEQTVIRSAEADNKPKRKPTSGSATNKDGVVISRKAEKTVKKTIATPKKPKQIALYSAKNLRWNGVGTLVKGYNVVNEEEAAKWKTLKAVREATPDEVATYYGKKK